MTAPTVSVVIPYSERFTPAEMLEEAIESADSQEGVDTEILVVDDENARGPAWARNRGLDRAATRYVAFLDADDLWEPDKLRRQLDRIAETGAGICLQGDAGTLDDFVYEAFVGSIQEVSSALLVDTDRVDTRFEEDLRRGEDNLFVLEAASQAGVCTCPELFSWRDHDESMRASGIDVEDYCEQAKRFGYLVSQRVPEAQPYLPIYYNQLYTDLGRACHRAGEYDRAVEFLGRAVRITPHPVSVLALGRSLLARTLSRG